MFLSAKQKKLKLSAMQNLRKTFRKKNNKNKKSQVPRQGRLNPFQRVDYLSYLTICSVYSLVPRPIFSPCSRVSFHLTFGLLSRKQS